MIIIFNCLKYYVNDISLREYSKWPKESLKNMQTVQTQDDPLKYTFGICSEKFFAFTVYKKGINLNSAMRKPIQAMEPTSTDKQLNSFKGRVSYFYKFVPALAKLLELS